MGLYSSFYASLSGLSANAGSLNVIGNNLANLNTIGFKQSSGTFQDLFNASLGAIGTQGNGNPIQIGLGSRLAAITQNFGQGSFQSTSNVTDMAISGLGFFMLQLAGNQGQAYTRAGNFTLDRNGYLVDPNGNNVIGWNRTGNTLSTNGTPSAIRINSGVTSPPVPTTAFSSTTNLNADALTGEVYSSPIQVVDSLGATHTLLFTYTKTANPGEWGLAITTDGGATVAGYPALVQFDASGQLTTPAANPTLTITGWTNGATSPATTWEVFQGTPPVPSLTGYAAPSATSNVAQDGYGAGTIRSLTVDQNGILIGNFTNGQTVSLAQVAMATFANVNGLRKTGDNTWSETLSSGSANVGAANEGGRGTVLGANLELSNVDVAEEFTKLIIAQRGYQANGRVVTTSDELLQETLNLKR
ncbi:MAG: Flagellar hook protein FlgE [Acidobacteria bacterium ADurb.Bin340]|nr:MAG: Flagellar hook protein FlgE [Acidobacteria bacterium ADurb.Bin340]